jgi:hypothetical protein
MFKHQLKRDLWSLLLIATAPSAAQSRSDTHAHSGRRAQANHHRSVESENTMSKWDDGCSSWMGSGVVLITARAASGM